MKTILKLLSVFSVLILLINACASLRTISFYENTDSYVDMKKERIKKTAMLAQQKKQEEERQKYIQDSIAKENEKINNNPYYKEPNYNKDDYYDYEYAARIKRFYNPVNGLGYYDNWYTNYGFYGDPYYGSSIYTSFGNYYPWNTYNYWSPYFSYGLGTCWGNPYFYPSYYGMGPWYSPYYGIISYNYPPFYYSPFPYSGIGYGYYPYGYFNSYDVNSATYAPRGSREGFNSTRTVNNISRGENNFSKNTVSISPEMNIPKFDETARPKTISKIEPKQINAVNAPLIHQINTNPNMPTNIIPKNNVNITKGNSINNTSHPGRPNNNGISKPIPVEVAPKGNNTFNNNSTQKNFNNNFGGNGGNGSSSPRGSNRPR